MKKLLALLLCVLLIATSSVVAFAETTVDATITVATVNGPFAEGDEIAIPITITEWANAYGGFNLEVLCESKALEFDRLENSTVDFSGALSTIYENKLSLIASPSSDRQAQKVDGGEICVAYYIAAEDITESVEVTVSATVYGYTYGEEDGWIEAHTLTADIVSGGVYVSDSESSNPDNPTPIGETTITVATVKGDFAAGDEIAIPISISEWSNGYATMDMLVDYDSTLLKLDCIEPSENDFAGAIMSTNDNRLGFIANPTSTEQANKVSGGEICVAYFVALTDIVENTSVTVTATITGYSFGEVDNWVADGDLIVNVVDGGIEYEETYQCKHTGETEIRDYVAEDCGNDGYTGDTYCKDCGVMIQEGSVIPATGAHTGGEATCKDKAECSVCGKEYGELDATNHKGETEIRDFVAGDCGNDGYSGDTYCKECGEMISEGSVIPATGAHTGGIATCKDKAECSVCGKEYGELDPSNHVGETEIRDFIAGDCGNDGYSGDTYCKDCGEMISEGSVIPATGAHTGGEATCKDKAVCDVCGKEYGELDPANHKGGTEVRNAKTEDCGNDGYTGDTYCLDCGEIIEEGEVIPATGNHIGGVATCCEKAVCDVCGKGYGELDADNHNGETIILDATNKYTGDIYCLGCDQMLSKGQKYGDVNGDGDIGAEDALIVLQFSVDKIELTGINAICADVDNNGIVDATDALLILQFSVDKITQFPREIA
ncbi:MAG: hypothetical protein IJ944_00855 [Clostridia bacterium]|nr:hypothetical protein [Clostridia bacterium]